MLEYKTFTVVCKFGRVHVKVFCLNKIWLEREFITIEEKINQLQNSHEPSPLWAQQQSAYIIIRLKSTEISVFRQVYCKKETFVNPSWTRIPDFGNEIWSSDRKQICYYTEVGMCYKNYKFAFSMVINYRCRYWAECLNLLCQKYGKI